MTVEQMAREAYDLWVDEYDLSGPTISDRCEELFGWLPDALFSEVEERAEEIATDESYRFAFGRSRPRKGRHA